MPNRAQVRRYLALGLVVGVPTAGPLVAGGMLLANGVPPRENALDARADAGSLASRFAPVLRFDSREPLVPIDRDGYLAHARLLLEEERRLHLGDVTTVVNSAPTIDTLPGEPASCPPPQGRFKACVYLLSLRGLRPRDGVKPFLALQQSILAAGATTRSSTSPAAPTRTTSLPAATASRSASASAPTTPTGPVSCCRRTTTGSCRSTERTRSPATTEPATSSSTDSSASATA